ncbi:MAG: hypothetical protein AB1589_29600 [Cyanobacteriota bacterium]
MASWLEGVVMGHAGQPSNLQPSNLQPSNLQPSNLRHLTHYCSHTKD